MAKIGIIGAGVAGMSAAVHLRAAGHQVIVFEANGYPGGKLTAIDIDGYRFDAGPSLFTVPHLLDEVFEAAGRNPRDYFDYIPIDPGCYYFWEDGTRFSAPRDPGHFAKAASSTFGVSPQDVERYLQSSGEIYDLTENVFLNSSLHRLSTYTKASTIRSMLKLYKARLFSTMHGTNQSQLRHPKLVQLFDRYATYNGSDPYRAPGTLTLIPTLEHRWGTFLPKGGMHSITTALHQLAQDIGVEFHFSEKVDSILTAGDKATGLSANGVHYPFDVVVSNMDVVHTYGRMLKAYKGPERYLKQERSSSAFIFYWGVKATFPEMGLHNIFWSDRYEEEFKSIFEKGQIIDDPTVYINITSKHEPGDAPPGCENWFILVNAPYMQGQNWDAIHAELRRNVLIKLSRILQRDIEPLIEAEDYLSPMRIESRTQSYLGSLYGTSSNGRLAAFLRHPNFSRKIGNLYFCGGSVHPGGGIPLCLRSGKLVSQMIG